MQSTAEKLDVNVNWQDFFISSDKKAGYIGVTSKAEGFSVNRFYGFHDRSEMIEQTKQQTDQYLTVNAFRLDFDKKLRRKTENLKQIRNVAIDIDQYTVGLSHEETLSKINDMVNSEQIPPPNLILTSNGIQLFYSIAGGASPAVSWLAEYITEQLIYKLKHIGADPNAKDLSRLMRVPNTINSKNNSLVQPSFWHTEAFALQELQRYVKPLETYTGRHKKRHNIVNADPALLQYYKTNYARLKDLENLIDLRQGDMTNCRNVFFYIYAYHKALVLNTFEDVLADCERISNLIYTQEKDKSMKWLKKTVESAYKDSKAFFEFYQQNDYKMVFRHNDGIKRPYKTENIIEKLSIQPHELEQLRSITTPHIKQENKNRYMRLKRLEDGTHEQTRAEYEAESKRKQAHVIELREQGYKQREIADMTGVSLRSVKSYLKKVQSP